MSNFMRRLNTLQLWANEWQVMFNHDKCQLIRSRVTNTELPILYDCNILEKKIKVESSVKYLGVYTLMNT